MMKNIQSIKVETHFGLVHTSIREAHIIADRAEVNVHITCNGIGLFIKPQTDPESTYRTYQERFAIASGKQPG